MLKSTVDRFMVKEETEPGPPLYQFQVGLKIIDGHEFNRSDTLQYTSRVSTRILARPVVRTRM